MSNGSDIEQFWRNRVDIYGSSSRATLRETAVRSAEISTIKKYLKESQRIVDIGCGNGFSTIQWAKAIKGEFLGIDYVKEMIDVANSELSQHSPSIRGTLRFEVGDIRFLDLKKNTFDAAITERCLQNLTSFEQQISAIKNISNILKDNALFLMLECSKTAVEKINHIREKLHRPKIDPTPWHNLFFQDDILIQNVESMTDFRLQKIDNFASNYIFATRVLPSIISRIILKARLGNILWRVPQFGKWGYFKLYIWQKSSFI